MTTIDLTATDPANVARVAEYFAGIGYESMHEEDPDLLTQPPYPCMGHDENPLLVPWFQVCYECVNGEPCDHLNADTLQGTGYTACARCGEVLTQEEPS